MDAGRNVTYEIRWTDRRKRDYKKRSKRMDPRLKKIIELEICLLKHDPQRGSELKWNFKDMRSIHIDQSSYRIVYETDYAASTITLNTIEPRDRVYDNLGRSR